MTLIDKQALLRSSAAFSSNPDGSLMVAALLSAAKIHGRLMQPQTIIHHMHAGGMRTNRHNV